MKNNLEIWSYADLCVGEARLKYVVVSNNCEIVSKPYNSHAEAEMYIIRAGPQLELFDSVAEMRRHKLHQAKAARKAEARKLKRRRDRVAA